MKMKDADGRTKEIVSEFAADFDLQGHQAVWRLASRCALLEEQVEAARRASVRGCPPECEGDDQHDHADDFNE